MSPPKIPSWEDLTPKQQEDHLTKECGLNILEEAEFEYAETVDCDLPEHEHPSWNMGSSELYSPEGPQWYDQPQFDRVLTTNKDMTQERAEIYFLRRCMELNCRRAGQVFFSTGRWCLRVRDVE